MILAVPRVHHDSSVRQEAIKFRPLREFYQPIFIVNGINGRHKFRNLSL
jgi:hypothetical protein